jgi:methylenetetrahydrofolate dehydrogenase (NADP+)/methenyltetrahydrofolate cyclohydrolase
MAVIDRMNKDPRIHGILLQLPLQKHHDEKAALLAIAPEKDVDGFHPINVGKMLIGEECFLPCTPHGVVQMLARSGVETSGKHVVVVGRSNIVGKPVAAMLLQKKPHANATVTICHTGTRDMAYFTRQADILVVAAGRPNTVTADMVKDGVVVMDVGVNRIPDDSKKSGFRLVGDVDFDTVKEKASLITPVPGGVGPMTITMLLYNTLESARRHAGLA